VELPCWPLLIARHTRLMLEPSADEPNGDHQACCERVKGLAHSWWAAAAVRLGLAACTLLVGNGAGAGEGLQGLLVVQGQRTRRRLVSLLQWLQTQDRLKEPKGARVIRCENIRASNAICRARCSSPGTGIVAPCYTEPLSGILVVGAVSDERNGALQAELQAPLNDAADQIVVEPHGHIQQHLRIGKLPSVCRR
jgi:hypothetical protein